MMVDDLPIAANLAARKIAPARWVVVVRRNDENDLRVGDLRLDAGRWWWIPAGSSVGVRFDSFQESIAWLRSQGS